MKEFEKLIEVADTLMGPEGCPWDRKQTFESLRPYVLEEGAELIDAVDMGNIEEVTEELGDLLYVIIFYCKVAEKEKKFTLSDVLAGQSEKLIRRHPHVYDGLKLKSEDHLYEVWNQIKKEEKKERKSALDGIPKGLTLLMRAQKMIHKLIREKFFEKSEKSGVSEKEIGEALFKLVEKADAEGIDAESALRSVVREKEETFRLTENQ